MRLASRSLWKTSSPLSGHLTQRFSGVSRRKSVAFIISDFYDTAYERSLALASAAWTFPTVNAYPLFVEPIPREQRGVLSALFLLCIALGGAIGDPMNGALFDLFGTYRPLFLMMATYTALAFVAVLAIPRGAGEAESSPVYSELSPADSAYTPRYSSGSNTAIDRIT